MSIPDPEAGATVPCRGDRALVLTCIGLGLVTLAVVSWLAAAKPIWLAPPLSNTFLMYGGILIVGLMVEVACIVLVWIKMRARVAILFAVAVAVLGCVGCSLVGGNFNLNIVLFPEDVTCEKESLPSNLVRYTCTNTVFFYTETYILEGSAGSPFLRLVRMETGGS